jgi:hypothetical protein
MGRPKPLRSYQAFPTGAGVRFEMQLNVDQKTLRDLMAAGAIGEAEILSLARKHRIPDMAVNLREMVWAVNVMKVTGPADDVLGEAAAFAEECKAVVGRLADKIADLQDDLGKFVNADPAGEGFIRFQGDGSPGVIEIDTALLARFREEADRTAQYLRNWWRARECFHAVTWHGDMMYLVNILERAAERAGMETDLGFGNPTGAATGFIEAILVRAGVITSKNNGAAINRAIRRHRANVKNHQSN